MRRRTVLVFLASVVLASRLAGGAEPMRVQDPVCALECGDANCGATDPGQQCPASAFADCTDNCTTKFTTCPSLAHCFVKCDEQRDAFQARCQRDRQACVRRFCLVPVSSAEPAGRFGTAADGLRITPALQSGACVRACRAARNTCAATRENVLAARRHCRANCQERCSGFPFPAAVRACLEHCDRFSPDDCRGDFESCKAGCQTGP
jgi:hypothetical protein